MDCNVVREFKLSCPKCRACLHYFQEGESPMDCRKCNNVVRGFKLSCPKCEARLFSPSDIGRWIATLMLIVWIVTSWLE
jgi:hypothetical protein